MCRKWAVRRPVLFILAAMAGTAAAEETAYTLDDVLVTRPRPESGPASTAVVRASNIDARRASTSDTASLLRDLPGVSLYGAGGVSSLPAIHGLADERVRILVDGAALIAACPNHMNPALSYIDPTRAEEITLYAGVTPVSVGGDSLGGTLMVDSAKPRFAEAGVKVLTQGEAGVFYRGTGDGHGGNVGVTLASEQLSIRYSGAIAQSDNYQATGAFKPATATGRAGHTLPLDEVGSTSYKTLNQALDISGRSGGHRLDLKLSRQHIPYENFPNQRMDMVGNDSDQIKLGYTGQYGWGLLKTRAWREDTEHQMDFGTDKRFWYGAASGGPTAADGNPCSPTGTSCAAGMPMASKVKTDGLAVNAELPLAGSHSLRLGGEYQAYRLDDWWPPSGAGMWPGTFWNIRDGKRGRLALFGEWETRLWPTLNGLVGLRHEIVRMGTGDVRGYNPSTNGTVPILNYQQRDGDNFNARDHARTDRNWDLSVLMRFTPDATQTYEAGIAQKTRSPSLYERYPWSTWSMAAVMNNFVGDGNGYVGNLDLRPEVAYTLSLAGDWHDAGQEVWGLHVAPYSTRVKDYIDARCQPGTTCRMYQFNVLQYVNQTAQLYGVDISAHRLVARTAGYGNFTMRGRVNYVRGKNRETDDNLFQIMPLHARLALTQQLGAWSHTLEAQFVAAKSDVSQIRNEIETAGYSLFNLRSRYAWKRASADFGIENLFDKKYDLPLSGAYVGQGTTMSINAVPWGIAVPGPGRSFYVGLTVKF